MAHFLVFVFVFASQLIAGFSTQKLPPPNYGNKLSILSIDGGGIKGIIPATVLQHLEKSLKLKDPTASLAHYFDVIAGTSTGGMITAMLTTPNTFNTNRPLFNASQVVDFYKENGPKIFDESSNSDFYKCPKYNATIYYEIARAQLKETRLSQTLTNVVIPTADVKKLKPVIFSNYKLKTYPYLDAKLSDISLGTSAAPTLFPTYEFKNDDVEFSLVDGAVAADNPAMVAVSEVIQHNEHKEIVLLSLGTGKTKVEEKLYNAANDINDDLCKLGWLNDHGGLIEQSSADMILYYLATVISADNYLRIQEYNLDPSMADMTNVTEENMDNLVKVGNNLLQQKVKRMNVNTFIPAEIDETNAEALDSLAEKLYEERQLRLKMKSMEKGGRPFIEAVREII